MMRTLSPKSQRNQTVTLYLFLLCALFATQFTRRIRHGPSSADLNRTRWEHMRELAERWSKTENVEWSQEIPGRGWSSPIVTETRSI